MQTIPLATGNVLAVVVLYKKKFEDVPCSNQITEWLLESSNRSFQLSLRHCLVYDNSPSPPTNRILNSHLGVEVFHNHSNGGTKAAYLYALELAKLHNIPWILLLDHDSKLPYDFFKEAQKVLSSSIKKNISAIVPRVLDGKKLISPAIITSYGKVRPIVNLNTSIKPTEGLTAIASASMIRTDKFFELLPIPNAFTLDYLDHWIFQELQIRGGGIVLSQANVIHSLSLSSMATMNPDRYREILATELIFLKNRPTYSRMMHLLWHILRTIKLIIQVRRAELIKICIEATSNILFKK